MGGILIRLFFFQFLADMSDTVCDQGIYIYFSNYIILCYGWILSISFYSLFLKEAPCDEDDPGTLRL